MNLDLTHDQRTVLKHLYKWYRTKHSPYITLGGYAGTGKTTIISLFRKILQQELDNDKKEEITKVAFCSYTGKGALVLKNRLEFMGSIYKGDTIGTIHSLIYSPVENANQEIVGWTRKDEVKADLLIIDEASMIDRQIWNDLLMYNIPIIAVGDHGQLPPIEGNFNLMQDPMLKLEIIHRQAAENPIIKVSQIARTDGTIEAGDYGKAVTKISQAESLDSFEMMENVLSRFDEDTLVLCGYNSTRIKINNFIRNALGFEDPEPRPGDRIICLRNNHDKQIFNGMLGTLESIHIEDENWYKAEVTMENGSLYNGLIFRHQFNSPEPINFTQNRKLLGENDIFDFGYALTVHKAQGSEARKVVLFEERFSRMDDENWKKWLYTAVTRAREELFIIGP